jgi:hypothetical protein
MPFLYRLDANDSPFIHLNGGVECPPGLQGFYSDIFPTHRSLLPDYRVNLPEPRSEYVESQIWKDDLGLDYVKEFVFFKVPPTRERYRVLKAKGIAVYDGRAWNTEPVVFQPKNDGDFAKQEPRLEQY